MRKTKADKAEWRYMFMPYCLDLHSDGTWLILNRWYVPLGEAKREWVDYKTHPSRVRMQLSAATRKLLAVGKPDPRRIYLYDDASTPTRSKPKMSAYLAKLEILAKLQIETVE